MRPGVSFVGQPIRSLQTMLRFIAAARGLDTSVVPDGVYGPQTAAAVSRFQRSVGLPVTGVTNQATWQRIVAAYEPSHTRVTSAQSINATLKPDQTVCREEENPNVYLAQAMLTVLAQVYVSVLPPAMSGKIDLPTSKSLESFQVLSALPMTGELDRITWKHLSLHFPLASSLQKTRPPAG